MCDQGEEQKQGYCGLCRVLYRDLNQHLSSLQHLDAVGLSSRGETSSSLHSSQSAHSLLERFLHDVLKHHPHSYGISQPDSTQHPEHHGKTTTPTHTAAPHQQSQVTWSTWQQSRRQQQRDDFSSEHCSSTIEEVIRRYCYGQEDDNRSESVHFSLPVSIETQTEWDVDVQEGTGHDVPLAEVETLLEVQVDVEQDYSEQLQWVLERPEGRGGYLERPIETVLPVPQLILPSFRGKSWAQIEKEDEARVLKLVQQFKTGVRTCYFDTESLARFGRRGYGTKKSPDLLPLFDHEEEEDKDKEQTKRQNFRLAARCQVVKLNRATQTVYVSSPTAPEVLLTKDVTPEVVPEVPPPEVTPAADAQPEPPVSGVFPEKYSSVLSPLQRQTSVMYLLCPPPCHTPQGSHPSPSPRRRRRPVRSMRSKVTYKRLPITPLTVKPFSGKPFSVKPRCVRRLFRNLSPELNTDPAPKVVPATAPRREGLRSCRPPRT